MLKLDVKWKNNMTAINQLLKEISDILQKNKDIILKMERQQINYVLFVYEKGRFKVFKSEGYMYSPMYYLSFDNLDCVNVTLHKAAIDSCDLQGDLLEVKASLKELILIIEKEHNEKSVIKNWLKEQLAGLN